MSAFSFKLPNGESFEIKMPAGATFDQAKAIFDQQSSTGGLVGFKVGDALSAATQAADGLAAAAAAAGQDALGTLNKATSGINLNSLAAGVGPGLTGALNQATAALSGSIPGVSSLTTGASAAVNGLISGATSGISGALGSLPSMPSLPGVPSLSGIATSATSALTSAATAITGSSGPLSAVTGALTGVAAEAGSLANNAVKTLTGALTGTPLNGINVADFAKQGPSLGAIAGLSGSAVTATLAQASKIIGQASDTMSSALGVGKFGLEPSQLEKAGFLKPGSAAAFLAAGDQDPVALLSSPLPWTGKDGVKGVGDILSNTGLQDKVQQDLMKTGLDAVKQIGLPVDKLSKTVTSKPRSKRI